MIQLPLAIAQTLTKPWKRCITTLMATDNIPRWSVDHVTDYSRTGVLHDDGSSYTCPHLHLLVAIRRNSLPTRALRRPSSCAAHEAHDVSCFGIVSQ